MDVRTGETKCGALCAGVESMTVRPGGVVVVAHMVVCVDNVWFACSPPVARLHKYYECPLIACFYFAKNVYKGTAKKDKLRCTWSPCNQKQV